MLKLLFSCVHFCINISKLYITFEAISTQVYSELEHAKDRLSLFFLLHSRIRVKTLSVILSE